jgi:CheY-like chemotaxis protein
VKQSGGTIWVYSEVGVGTVFRVYLPRVGGVRTEQPTERRVSPVGGNETILVIEDDQRVRVAVARMLERTGYRVLVAAGGEEALALAGSNPGQPIHVVLSDVIMPGMSGPDVVDALRNTHSGIRALFMSGYTEHPTLKRAASAMGQSAQFIQKPFTPDALAKKVREVLGASAPELPSIVGVM